MHSVNSAFQRACKVVIKGQVLSLAFLLPFYVTIKWLNGHLTGRSLFFRRNYEKEEKTIYSN